MRATDEQSTKYVIVDPKPGLCRDLKEQGRRRLGLERGDPTREVLGVM